MSIATHEHILSNGFGAVDYVLCSFPVPRPVTEKLLEASHQIPPPLFLHSCWFPLLWICQLITRNADMTMILVQFWGALPTINEGFMGDTPGGPEPLGDGSNPPLGSRHSPSNPSPYDESETRRDGQSGSQSSTLQRNYPPMQRSSSHQSLTPGRQDSFNMASIGNALDSSYPTYSNIQPQRYPPGASPSAVLYQLPNAAYTGQPAMIPPAQNLPYHVQYQSQYPAMYGHTQTPSSQNLQSGAQFYQGQGFIGQPQQPRSPFFANPGQYATPSHLYPTSPAAGQYGGRGRFAGDFRLAGQQRSSEHLSAASGGTAATTPGRSSSIGKRMRHSKSVEGLAH